MSFPPVALILPAAGRSTRFGGPRNKLAEVLGGQTVFARSLEAFLCRPEIVCVVIPTQSPLDVSGGDARIRMCAGGPSRAESVRNALFAVPEEIEWVAVHDAARPLVPQTLIDR